MKKRLALLLLIGAFLYAQNPETFNIAGTLRLTDRPPEATPVEALSFRIHPLDGGFDVTAQPDSQGRFLLKNVKPGHYELEFPMPGRLEVFAIGQRDLAPGDFALTSDDNEILSIVVSMRSATVKVNVRDPGRIQNDAIALLVPADDRLTLRHSCFSQRLNERETTFQFVPPGKYRVLVFNSKYTSEVAAYAPRFDDFLDRKSVAIEADWKEAVTASPDFVNDEDVESAIRSVSSRSIR